MASRLRASLLFIIVALMIMPRFARSSAAAEAARAGSGFPAGESAGRTIVVMAASDARSRMTPTWELVTRAAARAGLGEIHPADVTSAAIPRAPAWLATAQQELAGLSFAAALSALDAAVAEVALTGGAGLDTRSLDDLFLLRAVAGFRLGEATRVRAWDDFIRAATLAPERVLDAGRFAPAVVEAWERASSEVRRRPQGALAVRAAASTRVIVDGRAAVAAPATISGLPLGEHYLRVEEAGHVPWGTLVVVAAPFAEVSIPERALVTLDDRAAAALGQRAGAPFVMLVAPTSPIGASSLADVRVELTLLRAVDASRRDSVVARLDRGDDALAQAMTRLLEARWEGAARSAPLASLPDAGARRPPAERGRWWWWAGTVAAVVGAGVVTAFVVHDRSGSMGDGFTVTADPRRSSP